MFEKPAKERVQLTYLLQKLFRERNIELDQEKVAERLEQIASTYEDPEKLKKWYQDDQEAKSSLESSILEEQLIDSLYQQAKVSSKDVSFKELMSLAHQLHY